MDKKWLRQHHVGTTVRVIEDDYYGGPVPAGTEYRLIAVLSAGYQGMKGVGYLADGRYVSLSATNLEGVR